MASYIGSKIRDLTIHINEDKHDKELARLIIVEILNDVLDLKGEGFKKIQTNTILNGRSNSGSTQSL